MPIITPSSLASHIYTEVLNEIIRNDNTIAENGIKSALQEAKMYLGKYNLVALFGSDIESATIVDEMLNSIVKDIACWRIVRLANTIDFALFRTAYEDAIGMLKSIMNGDVSPDGWPYADIIDNSVPASDAISWNSNPPRNNYY